jgi:hypothetical protein
MLKDMQWNSKTKSVDLIVDSNDQQEIFQAVQSSLLEFYDTWFFDRLATSPGEQGYSEYYVDQRELRQRDPIDTVFQWNHLVRGNTMAYLGTRGVILGFIDHFHKLPEVSLRFAFRNPEGKHNAKFKRDTYVSRGHAIRFTEYIEHIMAANRKIPLLYLVEVNGGGDREALHMVRERSSLLRDMRIQLKNREIRFPFIYLGKHWTDQIDTSSYHSGPSYEGIDKQIDWLYERIEEPKPEHITHALTGVDINHIRVVAYPAGQDYSVLFRELEKSLVGERQVVRASINASK